MRRVALMLLAVVVMSAGCASVSYTEPTDGPRTRVRFAVGEATNRAGAVALYQENAVVTGFSDDNCNNSQQWMSLLDGYLVNSDPRSLGIPLSNYHRNAAKEFYVSTTRPLNIMFVGDMASFNGVSQTTTYCPVMISTALTPGVDYEFVYIANGARSCVVQMSEIVTGPAGARRNVIRTFDNGFDEVSPGCIDFFNRY